MLLYYILLCIYIIGIILMIYTTNKIKTDEQSVFNPWFLLGVILWPISVCWVFLESFDRKLKNQ